MYGSTQCQTHGNAPQIRNSARQRLLDAAPGAATELTTLLQDPDPAIRLRAATALLDRAGHGPAAVQVNVDGDKRGYEIVGVDVEAL